MPRFIIVIMTEHYWVFFADDTSGETSIYGKFHYAAKFVYLVKV